MSLINNMLQDLEERQALAGIHDDKVLGDLHAARERGIPGLGNLSLIPVFLLLAGLLACYQEAAFDHTVFYNYHGDSVVCICEI